MASLLDEFAEAGGGAGPGFGLAPPPELEVDLVEQLPTRSRGGVRSAAVARERFLYGTDTGWVVRHDYANAALPVADIELGKACTGPVEHVFLDRQAEHAVAVVDNGAATGTDAFYVHLGSRRARPLPKLAKLNVTAVGWLDAAVTGDGTGPLVVGTDGGQLWEAAIDAKGKDRAPRLLLQLLDNAEAVRSVRLEPLPLPEGGEGGQPRLLVMVATQSRFYMFVGGPTLDAAFEPYRAAPELQTCIELPGTAGRGELHLQKDALEDPARRFAWLAQPGVYHGALALEDSGGAGAGPGNEMALVPEHVLIPFREDAELGPPISMAATEYHFFVLYRDRVVAVNRISEEVAATRRFEDKSAELLGLMTDAESAAVFAYSTTALYEVSMRNEDANAWLLHLRKGEVDAALAQCSTDPQRDHVYNAQAERAFAEGQHLRAAGLYGKIRSAPPSFESIALKFADLPEALRKFLLVKLGSVGKSQPAQATMLSIWLTELLLDNMNRAALESGDASEEHAAATTELKRFMEQHRATLDESTTLQLLGSYGCVNEIVFYASLVEDTVTVVQYLLVQEQYEQVLKVLTDPKTKVPPDVWYEYAAPLMAAIPRETVDTLILCGQRLDPLELIPALLRFKDGKAGELPGPGAAPSSRAHVIRYLEHCVTRLGNADATVHYLLLTLLVQHSDPGLLLQYVTGPGLGADGRPQFDLNYALRLCYEEGFEQVCVHLHGMMENYEDAVKTALRLDVELAKSFADKAEDGEDRKKLWLLVADHVINAPAASPGGDRPSESENIRQALLFLQETDGLLKIEDILPFFPDFVYIDDFKDAICSCLEEYNDKIENLKLEMEDATQGAQVLRKDVAALAERSLAVPEDESCARCGSALFNRGSDLGQRDGCGAAYVYVFPCGHGFHGRCCLKEHLKLLPPHGAARAQIVAMQEEALAYEGGVLDAAHGANPAAARLDAALGEQCPYCGERVVRTITQPFGGAGEDPDSWAVV